MELKRIWFCFFFFEESPSMRRSLRTRQYSESILATAFSNAAPRNAYEPALKLRPLPPLPGTVHYFDYSSFSSRPLFETDNRNFWLLLGDTTKESTFDNVRTIKTNYGSKNQKGTYSWRYFVLVFSFSFSPSHLNRLFTFTPLTHDQKI